MNCLRYYAYRIFIKSNLPQTISQFHDEQGTLRTSKHHSNDYLSNNVKEILQNISSHRLNLNYVKGKINGLDFKDVLL